MTAANAITATRRGRDAQSARERTGIAISSQPASWLGPSSTPAIRGRRVAGNEDPAMRADDVLGERR